MSDARAETIIDPDDLLVLWRALEMCGIALDPSGPRPQWFHAPGYTTGLAVDARVRIEGDLELLIERAGAADKAFQAAKMIRLVLTGPSRAEERCKSWMTRIVQNLEVSRRMDCRSAEHFLGAPKDFAWHDMGYPRVFLATIAEQIRAQLEGWELLKVARARAGAVSKAIVLDRRGQRKSVYATGRFFYRRAESWLVLEINSKNADTFVSVAASGVPDGWEDELLQTIERSLESGDALTSRMMTPHGLELELDRKYHWDELFLDPETKSILSSEITRFFEGEEAYKKMGIPHRRGILLHGAPGTGKTLVGKIIASTTENVVFVWITAGDVDDARSVDSIFRLARFSRRTVLFFEDLDFYASRRATTRSTPALGALLVQLDGMHENKGLLVIATTNDLDAIEPALKDRPSRFDRVIEMKAAPTSVRRAHLAHLLAPYGVSDELIDFAAKKSEGLTGAQVQELAFRARLAAVRRADEKVERGDLAEGLDLARKFHATPVGFRTDDRMSDLIEID